MDRWHRVLFNHWEKRTREQMPGYTYGFNYEKASTRPASGCKASTGHHRIVRYDLNGLQMVVRFEVDACIPSAGVSKPQAQVATNVDDLVGILSGVSIGTPDSGSPHKPTATDSTGTPKITVISGGSYVPQSAIVELTTRSITREAEYDWKDAYPQLFLSQTPNHFLAVHQRGQFVRLKKRELDSPELDRVAANLIQSDLKKLRRVLDTIKTLVIKHGQGGRLSLVCQGRVLKVFERTSQDSCLPDEIKKLFEA